MARGRQRRRGRQKRHGTNSATSTAAEHASRQDSNSWTPPGPFCYPPTPHQTAISARELPHSPPLTHSNAKAPQTASLTSSPQNRLPSHSPRITDPRLPGVLLKNNPAELAQRHRYANGQRRPSRRPPAGIRNRCPGAGASDTARTLEPTTVASPLSHKRPASQTAIAPDPGPPRVANQRRHSTPQRARGPKATACSPPSLVAAACPRATDPPPLERRITASVKGPFSSPKHCRCANCNANSRPATRREANGNPPPRPATFPSTALLRLRNVARRQTRQ